MREWFYRLRLLTNRHVWWRLTQFADVNHPIPFLGGFASLLLLSCVSQVQELYLAYLEPPYDLKRVMHITLAGAALALLSSAIFFANQSLSNVTIEFLWSRSRDTDEDRRLRAWRNISGVATAALPWIGVGWGLWQVGHKATKDSEEIQRIAQSFDRSIPAAKTALLELTSVSTKLNLALETVVFFGVCLLALLYMLRRNRWARCATFTFVVLLFLASIFFPARLVDERSVVAAIELFRAIGPLAMILVDVLLIFTFVATIAFLLREVRLPISTVVFVSALLGVLLMFDVIRTTGLAIALLAIVAFFALLSQQWPVLALSLVFSGLLVGSPWQPFFVKSAIVAGRVPYNRNDGLSLEQSYTDWLHARESDRVAYRKASPARRYPVFIVAVEGGGIYAAAAASTFLSRLQALCPSFAQHVFAISGVSGGAVGASVFESLVHDREIASTGCDSTEARLPANIVAKSALVIQDDHLSPLLGFFMADLVGTYNDRAVALEQSLLNSIDAATNGENGMHTKFGQHWRPNGAAPALVLNTTWVETGYRVAFAPFSLEGLGGGTLYSFNDGGLRGNDEEPVSLAGAAVVSARFPAILPAYTIDRGSNRWNFVDGGYADASGALTALDIFNKLEPLNNKEAVDLRLILLTSVTPKLKFSEISGTRARDALTPVITLLSVRALLAEQAVTRAIDAVDPAASESLQTKTSKAQRGLQDWKLALIELDEQSFTLALGWKLSKSTNSIVSLMIGDPNLCDKANIRRGTLTPSTMHLKVEADPDSNGLPSSSLGPLIANSCTMSSILQLLGLTKSEAD
jgi:hypothetical protein